MQLTKKLIYDFLNVRRQMVLSTYDGHPWIATLYYAIDNELNIYFLSNPDTIHCKQLEKNPQVAVSVADSPQNPESKKKGIQLFGYAKRISTLAHLKLAIALWRNALNVTNAEYEAEHIFSGKLKFQLYEVTPKKIKFFNQELFKVEDGKEPILEL